MSGSASTTGTVEHSVAPLVLLALVIALISACTGADPAPPRTPTGTAQPIQATEAPPVKTATPVPEPTPISQRREVTVPAASGLEVVGQIGGDSRALALVGARLYLGVGPRVLALDVSDPTAPSELAASQVLAGLVQSIVPVGQYLYVAAGSDVVVLDPAEAGQPLAVVGRVDLGDHLALGLWAEPSHVYVGTMTPRLDASGAPIPFSYSGGITVLEASTPASPLRLASIDLDEPASGVAVRSGVLATDRGVVVDVSDPAQPVLVTDDVPAGEASASPAFIYAGDVALDVSDAAAPVQVVDFSSPGPVIRGLITTSDVRVTMTLYCDVGVCGGGARVAPLDLPSGAGAPSTLDDQLVFRDGYLYAAGFLDSEERGLVVYQVVAGEEPSLRLVGEFRPAGPSSDAAASASGDTLYSVDGDRLLWRIDARDPTRLTTTGQWRAERRFDGRLRLTGIEIDDERGRAYVAAWDDGLRAVDVEALAEVDALELSLLDVVVKDAFVFAGRFLEGGLSVVESTDSGLVEVASTAGAPSESITASGPYAATGHQNLVAVFDISDAGEPDDLARIPIPGSALGLAIAGDRLLVADGGCPGDGECRPALHIVRLDGQPALERSLLFERRTVDVAVAAEGDPSLAYVLTEGAPGQLAVWTFDLSDSGQPEAVGQLELAGSPGSVTVSAGLVLVSANDGGLYLLRPVPGG